MKIRILLTWLLLTISMPMLALTPAEVLSRVKGKINNSKGMAGNFRIEGCNGNGSGTFRFDGTRSYMHIPQLSTTWYNGQTMWTLNPRTKEVTVVTPSAQELKEANPLVYLNGIETDYRLYFSKRKENGKYLLLLNPKKTGSGIKAIEICVDATTFAPERMIIRDSNDRRTTLTLSNVSFNKKFMSTDFTYPSSRYKDYEIIDLR